MKNLYARVVLFLIRPAVQRAMREESKQGGSLWRMKLGGSSLVAAVNHELKCREAAEAAAR
ncbi:hypothetical protein EHZ19_26845 [Paraburkholderia bannensis]|nr:hypothetical protein [Paraburkholderia bannensis]RQM44726.1 hypothetical protein EHZ19_26845 [Paraburkholderia bannensis]